MARDATVPPSAFPVRRRHSSQNGGPLLESSPSRQQHHAERQQHSGERQRHYGERHATRSRRASEAISPTRRLSDDPLAAPRDMSTTGTDLPAPGADGGEQEVVPRVRFSTDVARRPSLKHKNSDDVIPDAEDRGRLRTPHTDAHTGVRGDLAGMGSRASSPLSSPSSRTPRPRDVTRPSRPGRNRGYSLRSALFQKNAREANVDGPDRIELGGVASSSVASQTRQQNGHDPGQGKKGGQTAMVQIRQVTSGASKYSDDSSKTDKKRLGARLSGLPNYSEWLERRAARNPGWRRLKSEIQRLRKIILRISEIPPSKDGRHIDIDPSRKDSFLDERTGKYYISNSIRSSRYNIWNFVPRQLWAQFSKLANFYFLVVSIFQIIPGLSTTGQFTTIVPLLFFVGVSISKEGYDDLRRYRLDKVENNQIATVLRSDTADLEDGSDSEGKQEEGVWTKVRWQNIRVGDVVKLERDDAVPADIILLSTQGPNGVATVETMALDGETNLKGKQVHPKLATACKTPLSTATSKVELVVEDPNLDLYNFEGKVTCGGTTAPLTNNEIVYRGSILRNTPGATGLVIYSGEECKIRMNANKNPRIKAPHLQSVVNKVVIVVVIFVIILSVINTVGYQVWRRRIEFPAWYLRNAGVPFFPILVSFIIMFNTMIPLSLYVSLEIVKLCQMLLLNDVDMYDEASNTPFEARTSTINEELGQVSYIFSDKTGTLTENMMKFRKISVAGTSWLHDVDLVGPDDDEKKLRERRRMARSGKGKKPVPQSRVTFSHPFTPEPERITRDDTPHPQEPHTAQRRRVSSQWQSSARPDKAQPELSTAVMIDYIQRRPHTAFAKKAKMLLLSIALCHTCLPEHDEAGNIDYQASSPDELALVRAAKELDFLVYNRDGPSLTLRTFPNTKEGEPVDEVYEVLDVIDFSSKRKRMSILVRCPDSRIMIICKGADTIVMERLRLASLARDKTNHIEARVSKRKVLEAQEAIRRRSEATDISRTSFSRTSISLPRRSFGIGGASTGGKLQPIRDEVDSWLNEREHDVTAPHDPLDEFYTPRPSMHATRRSSMAASESHGPIFQDHDEEEEDLVDDDLATDDDVVVERCFQHVNDFATEGLRTLLYGHRFLTEQEYTGWKKIYLDATTSLVDRQNMIERAGELIEQSLELTGATAIEDKLQYGVPEAIDKLRRANIKMWMLTGDKRETAINIGHSCRLIKDYSTVTILDKETGQLEQHIAAAILDVTSGTLAHSVIVIDGQTLALVESEPELRKLFLDLAIYADSVVCCRASPSQKSGLVKAIRHRVKNSITLAIGDGANDIAMIQEAHVGIGITGREGLQAARVSDYSIAQFRFLVKLLLVHGRWNYVRVCKYTVGTFWKEMVFYLVQAMYQRYNGYTGTSLYEPWSLSVFNTLFTSLCVIFLGVFEKDLSAATLVAVPELYSKGQRNQAFNFKIYLGWMFTAVCEAMIIFFVMLSLYGQTQFTDYNDLFSTGDLAYGACIILINLKLQGTEIHYKSFLALLACVVSIGGWFLWNIVLSGTYHDNKIYYVRHGFTERFGRNVLWWLVLFMAVAATLLFELVVRSVKAAFAPTDTETFQVLEKDPDVRRRFEDAAAMELRAGWSEAADKRRVGVDPAEEARMEKEMEDLIRYRTGEHVDVEGAPRVGGVVGLGVSGTDRGATRES